MQTSKVVAWSRQKINSDINGNIYAIGINKYTLYKNITINGHMAKGLFAGKLAVKDENVDLSFEGSVDIAKPIPVFNFFSQHRQSAAGKASHTPARFIF